MNFKYIRIASDLHLEAFSGRDAESLTIDFVPRHELDSESILVLAGDISNNISQLMLFIKFLEDRFAAVIYVPGNHEFYRQDFFPMCETIDTHFAENFKRVFWASHDVKAMVIDGVRFIYGTLWGDGGPTLRDQAVTGSMLNDFRIVKFDGRRFTVPDMIQLHKQQKAAIDAELRQPFDGKVVVITHHMPSRRLVSPRFWEKDGSDGANGGFVGACEDILAYDHAPNLWIHGHTHDVIDTSLWKTRIICNPTGYRGEWGASGFASKGPVFIAKESL